MNLPKPVAVLFDWDNTLVNTWPIIHQALHDTFMAMGREPWSIEQTRQRVRHSLRDSFPKLFGEHWEKAGELYQHYYQQLHLARLEALPEAEALLSYLQGLAIPLAVVSNKRGPNLRKEIGYLGWEHYFAAQVGADDAARDKPHPAPVLLALRTCGMEAGPHVWFVGDSEVDLECAHATGCTPLLYGDKADDPFMVEEGKYGGFIYSAHVTGHSDLINIFETLGLDISAKTLNAAQ